MNQASKVVLSLCCTFLCLASFGQIAGYRYKRALSGTSDLWHKIVVPDSMYEKLTPELNDIRIVGITQKNDTIVAPYILNDASGRIEDRKIACRIINQSNNARGWFYTLELTDSGIVNHLDLSFGKPNFDWRVNLEGSVDQKEWFTILEDYRILSLTNNTENYKFTNLSFPDARYTYFRVNVVSPENPDLLKASLLVEKKTSGMLKKYSNHTTKVMQDKALRETIVSLTLPTAVPISEVKLYVADTLDYYRTVTLRCLRDSFVHQSATQYNYEQLSSGIISKLRENKLTCKNTIAKTFELVIDNRDNRPLRIDSVELSGYQYELMVRFPEPAAWSLFYDNEAAPAPEYDLAVLSSSDGKIPSNAKELKPGEEESTATNPAHKTQPLFQNKQWLWICMVIIIAVLGWFSYTMIKKENTTDS